MRRARSQPIRNKVDLSDPAQMRCPRLTPAGHGHWLTGTGMLIVAYGVSLVVVERLFKVVKFKLMTMKWFAALWTWFTAMRNRMWVWVRAQTGKPHRPSPEPVSIRTLPTPVRRERVVIKRWT
jgi:hypothetical protein